MDDVLKSASAEDETIKQAKDTKAVCQNGGFNLPKFVGNRERIISSIPQEHRAKQVKNLSLGQDKLPTERALGVIWCIESDMFNFRIELKDKPCTRRGILSTISSIYDPLGFIAPVVLVGNFCRISVTLIAGMSQSTMPAAADGKDGEMSCTYLKG